MRHSSFAKVGSMDSSFWLGVMVTTILAIPAGVVAIALHGRMVRYLDSRKITSREKHAKAAKDFYKIVQDLRAGRRDKYIYMLEVVSVIVVCSVIAMVTITGAIVILALAPISLPENANVLLIVMGLVFLSFLFAFLCSLSIRRSRDVTNALEDFDSYERDFISKWGTPNDI
jgi:hypothetical protein